MMRDRFYLEQYVRGNVAVMTDAELLSVVFERLLKEAKALTEKPSR